MLFLADRLLRTSFLHAEREVKELSHGATLDFAYAVHTDVGNRCTGASRPDRTEAPLEIGDTVEVITTVPTVQGLAESRQDVSS